MLYAAFESPLKAFFVECLARDRRDGRPEARIGVTALRPYHAGKGEDRGYDRQRRKIRKAVERAAGGHATYGNSFLIALNGEVIRQDVEASMS